MKTGKLASKIFAHPVDYTFRIHKLGSDIPAGRTNRWVSRHEFGLGIVIGL